MKPSAWQKDFHHVWSHGMSSVFGGILPSLCSVGHKQHNQGAEKLVHMFMDSGRKFFVEYALSKQVCCLDWACSIFTSPYLCFCRAAV
mmetsp:Transcript_30191/g.45554  ORF Transcript_30191/g.45554 Transcript_30191/m.45554 type:complete len:88 (+) Transcript_30191:993-1256(+)